jgi:trehalose 6-phosphate phosphatase
VLDTALRALTEHPARAAILCDIDGTLAPIVERAEEARVPPEATRVLAELSRRYAVVACVSGRSALDAKRLTGVGAIAYAGGHGAELLWPGDAEPAVVPEFARYRDAVHDFAAEHDGEDLRTLGVRIEDKGPIVAFHWRGAPDEEAAHAHLREIAAETDGLATHWGRKVLEIRPPVEADKGSAVRALVRDSSASRGLYAGDDATDIDAFQGLAYAGLEHVVRVAIASDEAPPGLLEAADLVVDGPEALAKLLSRL